MPGTLRFWRYSKVQRNLAFVSACVGGAVKMEDTEKSLEKAGFQQIKIVRNKDIREFIRRWDPSKSDNVAD
jgi:hypothetical protein